MAVAAQPHAQPRRLWHPFIVKYSGCFGWRPFVAIIGGWMSNDLGRLADDKPER